MENGNEDVKGRGLNNDVEGPPKERSRPTMRLTRAFFPPDGVLGDNPSLVHFWHGVHGNHLPMNQSAALYCRPGMNRAKYTI